MKSAVVLLAGFLAAPVLAAPCPAGAPPALPLLPGWGQPAALDAAVAPAGATSLALDRPMTVTLKPTGQVSYEIKPVRAPKPDTFGGNVAFDVPAAGRYRLAMGTFAWVDVVEDGRSLPSKERDHSLPCVSKVLDFELKAGRHLIQIADEKAATTKMMLIRGQKPPAPPKPPTAAAATPTQ